MATLTPLVPNFTLSNTNINQWTGGTSGWTDLGIGGNGWYGDIDDAVGAIDATGEQGAAPLLNHNTTEIFIVGLTDVDADFGSMVTISIHGDFHTANAAPGSMGDDQPDSLEVRITNSGATTDYVAWTTLHNWDGTVWSGALGQPAANQTAALTLTAAGLSASEADWNGAELHFRFISTKIKGNDNATPILIIDARLTGTYTPGAAAEKVPTLHVIHRDMSRARLRRESGRMG